MQPHKNSPVKIKIFSVLLGIAFLTGCAVRNDHTEIHGLGLSYHSDVRQMHDGNYFTEAEAAPAAGRASGASAQAIKVAVEYCEAQQKAMKVVKSESASHLFVNGVSRIIFRCV